MSALSERTDIHRVMGLEKRIEELEAALRPFAEAYHYTQQMGVSMREEYYASMTCTGKFTPADLAKAAELV